MEASTIAPVAQQFSTIRPEQFGEQVNNRQQSAERITNAVVQTVQDQELTPIEGMKIISAVWGVAFAYSEFHQELKPADLLSVLSQQSAQYGGSQGSRQSQL